MAGTLVRALGIGACMVGACAAVVIVILGALLASTFAISVATYGCLRPTAARLARRARAAETGDTARPADVSRPGRALREPSVIG